MLSISCGNGSVLIGIHLGRFVLGFYALQNELIYLAFFNICCLAFVPFQSTASVAPQLWQPNSGTLMTNDISETNPAEDSAACIALSKNDSYVMSASGGKVSLFNMMTFKVHGFFSLFLSFELFYMIRILLQY